MTTTIHYLTNEAYGYPRGAERRVEPIALMCVHITGNPSTPPATAQQERDYANRPGSNGPSAHNYIDRDGSLVEAIDPKKYAAWSNGDIRSPVTKWSGIQTIAIDWPAGGRNPNEAYYREVECCGRPGSYPITVKQKATLASLIARDSVTTGLPINRSTVHTHSLLNTETRSSCPVPADDRTDFLDDLIAAAKAQALINELSKALAESAAEAKRWQDEAGELYAALRAAVEARDACSEQVEALRVEVATQQYLAIERDKALEEIALIAARDPIHQILTAANAAP